MNKLRTLLSCIVLSAFLSSQAGGIDFLHDKKWKEILAQAKKENKIIFLDAYTSWCGPCKYMQSDVFTDAAVTYYYNKNFINVKMDMEEGEGIGLAGQLGVTSYPTLFFIDGDGQVLHKKIGAMEPSEFLQLGEDALNPARQFYTMKNKVMTGEADAEAVHQWIHEAEQLEEDVDSAIMTYLQKTMRPKIEKEMLSIMLDHAPLNKQQVEFLFRNKEACLTAMNRTADQFNSAMQARVTVYATNESLKGETFDFVKFKQLVQNYFPAEAELITRKVKIRYYNYQEEYKKSLDELADCITSPALKIGVNDLSDLVVQNIKIITDQHRVDEFIQKTSQYKLSPAEANKAHQKNLALFVLYYCKDDKANMKSYSDNLLKDANTPEEIKSKVKEFLEAAKGE